MATRPNPVVEDDPILAEIDRAFLDLRKTTPRQAYGKSDKDIEDPVLSSIDRAFARLNASRKVKRAPSEEERGIIAQIADLPGLGSFLDTVAPLVTPLVTPEQPTPAAKPTREVKPIENGNVDLFAQPEVQQPDGSKSTVFSMSFNEDGREVLIPRVTPDGKLLSEDDAIDYYHKTGRHLGKFGTPEEATEFSQTLHEKYAAGKYKRKPATMPTIGPRDTGVTAWLEDVYADLTQGGEATLPGRVYKGIGGQPFNTPVGESLMGGIPLGLTKAATGVSRMAGAPFQKKLPVHRAMAKGATEAVGGALQAATLPLAVTQPGFLTMMPPFEVANAAVEAATRDLPLAPETKELIDTIVPILLVGGATRSYAERTKGKAPAGPVREELGVETRPERMLPAAAIETPPPAAPVEAVRGPMVTPEGGVPYTPGVPSYTPPRQSARTDLPRTPDLRIADALETIGEVLRQPQGAKSAAEAPKATADRAARVDLERQFGPLGAVLADDPVFAKDFAAAKQRAEAKAKLEKEAGPMGALVEEPVAEVRLKGKDAAQARKTNIPEIPVQLPKTIAKPPIQTPVEAPEGVKPEPRFTSAKRAEIATAEVTPAQRLQALRVEQAELAQRRRRGDAPAEQIEQLDRRMRENEELIREFTEQARQPVATAQTTTAAPLELTPITATTAKPNISANRFVTEEAYKQAKEDAARELRALATGAEAGALGANTGAYLTAVAKIGAYHFERGARTFAAWSEVMIRQMGEAVRPYLAEVWKRVQAGPQAVSGSVPRERSKATVIPFEPPKAAAKAPGAQLPRTPPTAAARPASASIPRTPGTVERAGNLRLDKLEAPEDVLNVIRQTAKDNAPKLDAQRRGVVSIKETEAAARKLVDQGYLTSRDVGRLKKGTALNAEEMRAAGGLLLDASERVTRAKQAYKSDPTQENQLRLLAVMQEQTAVQTGVAGATAEAGRALRILREVRSALRQNSPDNYAKVIEAMGGDKVSKEVIARLMDIPETDLVGLNKFLRKQTKFTNVAWIRAYWVNSILSGPRSQIRNVVGNTINGLTQPIVTAVTGPVDAAVAAATRTTLGKAIAKTDIGQRVGIKPRGQEVFAAEALPQLLGFLRGFSGGARKAVHMIRNGITFEDAAKLELPTLPQFTGLATPLGLPGRMLSAADMMARTMAYEGRINALAVRTAMKEGLRGERLADRIAELLDEPTEAMMAEAMKLARFDTFTESPDALAGAVLKMREALPGGAFITPFVNTPLQIVRQQVKMVPGTAAVEMFGQAKRGKLSSPETSDAVARNVIGTMVLLPAIAWALEGKITGPAPRAEADKDEFYRLKKQPFSIRVGDKWVSYKNAGPYGMLFAAAAAYNDAYQKDGAIPTTSAISYAAGVLGKYAISQSFFDGYEKVSNAFDDPGKILERTADFATNIAQGFVPFSGLLRNVAQSQDDTMRDPETLYERLRTGIPGMSEDVPAKLDALGREVKREGAEGIKAFLPEPLKPAEPVPMVDRELARLGIKVGFVGGSLNVGDTKVELTPEDRHAYQVAAGKAIRESLEQLFNLPAYENLTREEQEKTVNRAIDAARRTARNEMVQGLLGQEDGQGQRTGTVKNIPDGTVVQLGGKVGTLVTLKGGRRGFQVGSGSAVQYLDEEEEVQVLGKGKRVTK